MRGRSPHLRRVAVAALVSALAPALLGCGTLDRDAVQSELQSIESASAEGSLVAHEVERDRTLRSFAVIRTAELHKQAENASEALQETPPEQGLESSAKRGVVLGDRASSLIERLHNSPTDRAVAHDVRLKLDRIAGDAGDLADAL